MPGYPSRALTESPSERPGRVVRQCVRSPTSKAHFTSLHFTSANFGLPPSLLWPFLLAFPFFLLPRRRDRPHSHAQTPSPSSRIDDVPNSPPSLSATLLTHSSGNDKYLATEEVTVQLTEGERATLPLMPSTPTHHRMDLSSLVSHFQNVGIHGCQIIPSSLRL